MMRKAKSKQLTVSLINSYMKKFLSAIILLFFLWSCTGSRKDATFLIAEKILEQNNDRNVKLVINQEEGLLSDESFHIETDGKKGLKISAPSSVGLLYGVFALQRYKDSGLDLNKIDTIENPYYQYRILNHWDNLDGTIERGYAGHSLWKWDDLPDSISPYLEQ